MSRNRPLPVLGFAAYSGTGKTTLLLAVVSILKDRGYRVGIIKHAHHRFDTDQPGKDSYELRKAGATQTLVGSRRRWALVTETAGDREPRLAELIARLDPSLLDLVLVEGFKSERFPKIEVYRPARGAPMLHRHDDSIVAVASDAPGPAEAWLPQLDLNRPETVADFILQFLFHGTLRPGSVADVAMPHAQGTARRTP